MPKLRRLSGLQVIGILEQFGFVVTRVKGSHYRLKLVLDDQTCCTTVPVARDLFACTGTLRAILRQVAPCVSEDELQLHFYAD